MTTPTSQEVMTQTTHELLPCPKCNGEAEVLGENFIACKNFQCGVQMDWGHWCGPGAKKKLIEGWNTRAQPSQPIVSQGLSNEKAEGVDRAALEAAINLSSTPTRQRRETGMIENFMCTKCGDKDIQGNLNFKEEIWDLRCNNCGPFKSPQQTEEDASERPKDEMGT